MSWFLSCLYSRSFFLALFPSVFLSFNLSTHFLTDHLCDMYMSGRLKPVGYEMKYHLDNFAPSIVKDYVDPSTAASSSSSSAAAFNNHNHEEAASSTRGSLKRRSRDGGASSSKKSQRLASSSSSFPPPLTSATTETLNGDSSSSSSALVEINSSSSSAVYNDASAKIKTLDLKQETEEISLLDDDDDNNHHDGGGGGVSLIDDDVDFTAMDFNSTDVDSQHSSHQQPRNPRRRQQQLQQLSFDDSSSGAVFDASHDSVSDVSLLLQRNHDNQNQSYGPLHDMSDDIPEDGYDNDQVPNATHDIRVRNHMTHVRAFLAASPKAAALRGLTLVDCKADLGLKGSASYRIMTSLIYELATLGANRVLHLHQRHPLVETFRSEILDELMNSVAIFAELEADKFCLFEGPKRKSMRSFLKESINRFFRNRLARKDKVARTVTGR